MKYVVVMDMVSDMKIPIMFSEILNHSTIPLIGNRHEVVSAGHCDFDALQGKWCAYGDSFTLKMHAVPGDSELLNEFYPMVKA